MKKAKNNHNFNLENSSIYPIQHMKYVQFLTAKNRFFYPWIISGFKAGIELHIS